MANKCPDDFTEVTYGASWTCFWLSDYTTNKDTADQACLDKTNSEGHLAVTDTKKKHDAMVATVFDGIRLDNLICNSQKQKIQYLYCDGNVHKRKKNSVY